jgi:hypothetical protein
MVLIDCNARNTNQGIKKMMIIEFTELLKTTKKIDSGKKKLIKTLFDLLSRTDKVFCITVDGMKFDFKPTFTEEETHTMDVLRLECITALLKKSMVSGNWESILALAMGVDPMTLQFEKYEATEEYEINEENKFEAKNTKTDGSKPDGEETWYLKQQRKLDRMHHNPVTGLIEEVEEDYKHKDCDEFFQNVTCEKGCSC